MSELKPVEEMTHLEVNNEIMERRHDCGLNYNIGRWALKWLRFEQDGIDAVLKDLNLDREDIYDNGHYYSILRRILEEREDRKDSKQPDLDWGELVELLGDLRDTVDLAYPHLCESKDDALREFALARKWIDRLTAAFGPFDGEPVEESESEESDCVPEKPKGFEGVHEWVWVNDGWELKKIEGAEQPTPLDIDTPTLKRCGSRVLVTVFENNIDDGTSGISLKAIRYIGVVPRENSEHCDFYYEQRNGEMHHIVTLAKDARIIQNAWLEMGR